MSVDDSFYVYDTEQFFKPLLPIDVRRYGGAEFRITTHTTDGCRCGNVGGRSRAGFRGRWSATRSREGRPVATLSLIVGDSSRRSVVLRLPADWRSHVVAFSRLEGPSRLPLMRRDGLDLLHVPFRFFFFFFLFSIFSLFTSRPLDAQISHRWSRLLEFNYPTDCQIF